MANEIEILTESADGTSWVDLIPAAVSTGYQAQNTNIEAGRNGIDLSYITYDSVADEIVISPSKPIDVNGVPFEITTEIRLANPGTGLHYFRVIAGATDIQKSIEIVTDKGTFNASKNALYDGTGNRILNWVFDGDGPEVAKLLPVPYTGSVMLGGGNLYELQYFNYFPTDIILDSFASPADNPYDLAYDTLTGNLISSDLGLNRIYIHDGVSSTILSSFAGPGTATIGVAYDTSTGNLISSDTNTELIYIHDGVSSTILSSFAGPGTNIYGITYDTSTGNLISCDVNTDLIYIHDGVSSTILSSFASPGTTPRSATYSFSTGNLISSDQTLTTIYVHDKVSATILTSITSPSGAPTGLASDLSTGNLISCDPNVAARRIYVHKSELKYFAP